MIEVMLEAERALAVGLLDQAERLYRQVLSADPKNAIAIVGLARVALERGDEATTYVEARRALALDPDNPAAAHLTMRMAEILEGRGEALPSIEPDASAPPANAPTPVPGSEPRAEPVAPAQPGAPAQPDPRGVVDRLLRRRRS